MKYLWLIAALAILPVTARAEIVKTAVPDCKTGKLCLHWWPKLAVPAGWRFNPDASLEENAYFVIPEKATDMRVFMYANAVDAKGQADTLKGFVDDDIAAFHKKTPDLTITEQPALTTADGQSLRVFRFDPTTNGRWEMTAYGEETDKDGNRYYLVFVLSGKTPALRDQNLGVFQATIAAYRK